jgi:regulator of replication initiation timing
MDDVFDQLEEYEDVIKELQKLVSDLRVQVANKRDK